MYAKCLRRSIIKTSDPLPYAAFKVVTAPCQTLIAVDNNEKYAGVVTEANLPYNYPDGPTNSDKYLEWTVGDICNRDGKYLQSSQNPYLYGAQLFATYDYIYALPIINESKDVIDVLLRSQVFYNDYYRGIKAPHSQHGGAMQQLAFFPYPHYGEAIRQAAHLAKQLGYTAMSVIEFGVFSGRGLLACEFHAQQVSRLTGLDIEIYGFDNLKGQPESDEPKDMQYLWPKGMHTWDTEPLRDLLSMSKWIIGDTNETCASFLKEYKPAPIGVMLVDVDYYTSTVPILSMLEGDHENFLPRVIMWFDDIAQVNRYCGEALAIEEFNQTHADIKIDKSSSLIIRIMADRFRTCHRFTHKLYSTQVSHLGPDRCLPWV